MNGTIEERRDGLHWSVVALLVVALTLAPVLVPLFATLSAAEAAPGRAPVTHNDRDGDGVVDTVDIDDDNDGVPDIREIDPHGRDRDSDGDGMPDRIDLDSDNDGIVDWREAGAAAVLDLGVLRVVGGRLVGEVGENGLIDLFESPADSGRPAYALADSDDGADAFPDLIDLDSDNDGLPDLVEAGVAAALDGDRDGRIDAPPGSVGNDGIADHLQTTNDLTCCDVTGDGVDDVLPRDTDGQGTPDYRDLDSDDDGVDDLVELGGDDIDGDGRVDTFVDIARLGDGMDDALLVVPLVESDVNGNGLADHLDMFAPDPTGGISPEPSGGVSLDDAVAADAAGPADAAVGDAAAPDGAATDTAAADAADGLVRVGLGGSGCSIGAAPTDLMLLLCALFGVAGIGWRLTLRRVGRR